MMAMRNDVTMFNQYGTAALYAGGWTYEDHDELSRHYNLDDHDIEQICDGLLMEEFADVARRKAEEFNINHEGLMIAFDDLVTDFTSEELRVMVQDSQEVDISDYVDMLIERVEAEYDLKGGRYYE